MTYSIEIGVILTDEANENKNYNVLEDPQFKQHLIGEKLRYSELYQLNIYLLSFINSNNLVNFVASYVEQKADIMIGVPELHMDVLPAIYVISGVTDKELQEFQQDNPATFLVRDGKLEEIDKFLSAIRSVEEISEIDLEFEGDVLMRQETIDAFGFNNQESADLFYNLPALNRHFLIGSHDSFDRETLTKAVSIFGVSQFEGLFDESGLLHDATIQKDGLIITITAISGIYPRPWMNEYKSFLDIVITTDTDESITNDKGLHLWAEEFGFCLSVEMPYDSLSGELIGYRVLSKGQIISVKETITEEEYMLDD